MTKDDVKAYLSKIGKRGGQTTLKKFGKAKMTVWGRRGGRPRGTGKKKGRK